MGWLRRSPPAAAATPPRTQAERISLQKFAKARKRLQRAQAQLERRLVELTADRSAIKARGASGASVEANLQEIEAMIGEVTSALQAAHEQSRQVYAELGAIIGDRALQLDGVDLSLEGWR